MSSNPTLSLAPYLALTRELTALIVPIRPTPAFKTNLEASLLAAARRQYAMEKLRISTASMAHPVEFLGAWREYLPEGRERRWMIGAAAVGSAVSVAGLVAYLWRQRSQRAA